MVVFGLTVSTLLRNTQRDDVNQDKSCFPRESKSRMSIP